MLTDDFDFTDTEFCQMKEVEMLDDIYDSTNNSDDPLMDDLKVDNCNSASATFGWCECEYQTCWWGWIE